MAVLWLGVGSVFWMTSGGGVVLASLLGTSAARVAVLE
jgi:hypothetical protein